MTAETSSPSKEIGYATIIHVVALLGNFLYIALVPFANIIIPWVLWLCKRKENPFIDEHGREAIRFQLFMTLYWFIYAIALLLLLGTVIIGMILVDPYYAIDIGGVIASVGGWFLFFLVLSGFLFVLGIYCPIKAAVRASDGKSYCYPFVFSPRKNKTE